MTADARNRTEPMKVSPCTRRSDSVMTDDRTEGLAALEPAHRCNICGGLVTFDGTPPALDYKAAGRVAGNRERAAGLAPAQRGERERVLAEWERASAQWLMHSPEGQELVQRGNALAALLRGGA